MHTPNFHMFGAIMMCSDSITLSQKKKKSKMCNDNKSDKIEMFFIFSQLLNYEILYDVMIDV